MAERSDDDDGLPLTDEEIRAVFKHFQQETDFLAHAVGEALSLLAAHCGATAALDAQATRWAAVAAKNPSATRIMERLQKGLETPPSAG